MAKKHVFSYGAGKAEAKGADLTKNVLGGKGIGLMEMTSIGINVPAGFTVSIQTCAEYYKLGKKLPATDWKLNCAMPSRNLKKSPARNWVMPMTLFWCLCVPARPVPCPGCSKLF